MMPPPSLPPARPHDCVAIKMDDETESASSWRELFSDMPVWVISMLFHLLLLLLLGLVPLAERIQAINVISAAQGETEESIEDFSIDPIDPDDVSPLQEEEALAEPIAVDLDQQFAPLESTPQPSEISEVAAELSIDQVDLTAVASSTPQTLAAASVSPFGGRSKKLKQRLLQKYGGTRQSEAAVAKALKWLADHQLPSGAWTFQHDIVCNGKCGDPGEPIRREAVNAATSLALLPFLGAGQTHFDGEYSKVIYAGLRFLIQNGRPGTRGGYPVLDLTDRTGAMYSHGLATIVLSEAYALTQDPELAVPAQTALNFVTAAQGRDGGWRYVPGAPDGGDTSVTGWQLMALKSGHLGHLDVSTRSVSNATLYLDKVSSEDGALYGYNRPGGAVRPGCMAIGLLCRMYTGWDRTHPGIVRGVDYLHRFGVDKTDIYYNYYAAQVLRQYGGPKWDAYNQTLRDWLVAAQATKGGAAGSWHFPDSKEDRGPIEGGRLVSTAFSTMILEVYYRHLPLYNEAAIEDDFPL